MGMLTRVVASAETTLPFGDVWRQAAGFVFAVVITMMRKWEREGL